MKTILTALTTLFIANTARASTDGLFQRLVNAHVPADSTAHTLYSKASQSAKHKIKCSFRISKEILAELDRTVYYFDLAFEKPENSPVPAHNFTGHLDLLEDELENILTSKKSFAFDKSNRRVFVTVATDKRKVEVSSIHGRNPHTNAPYAFNDPSYFKIEFENDGVAKIEKKHWRPTTPALKWNLAFKDSCLLAGFRLFLDFP